MVTFSPPPNSEPLEQGLGFDVVDRDFGVFIGFRFASYSNWACGVCWVVLVGCEFWVLIWFLASPFPFPFPVC